MTARSIGFRPEIQGLRAIAVLVVLVFHLWPGALPGGYVGVDVFFVISGYLITGLLLREAERDGRISILGFYAKRIRRLMPAATLVLVAVAICISILPVVRWEETAKEIIASALYVENWWLAANSVDYLALESAPSPLQHYWSLSIEEQYYIVWPLLFALAWWIPGLRAQPRTVFGVLVVGIGILSLLHSIHITAKNPGFGYFATTTRAWELAIGGGLAVFTGWRKLPAAAKIASGYLGMAGIALAALTYDSTTVFPGYHALLPTVGTALVLVSSDSRWAPYAVLKTRPFQYFGDISYSLYLWHWPVVIFYQQISGRSLGLIDGVIVAAVSTAFAHQSKYLVEDPFRAPGFPSPKRWVPFALAAICIGWSLVSALFVLNQVRLRTQVNASTVAEAATHPGAMAIFAGVPFDPAVPFAPQPLQAAKDQALAYRDGCIASLTNSEVRECRYGNKVAERHILIVGDSHAVHWIPALDVIAHRRGWKLTVITKSACPMARIEMEAGLTDQMQSCIDWNRTAIEQVIAYQPDVVVFAHSWGSMTGIGDTRTEGAQQVAEWIETLWQELQQGGSSIIAIRDTPRMKQLPSECMAAAGATSLECANPRSAAIPPVDPLVIAAERNDSALLVDMTDYICGPELCEPVVGNVFVWRDTHHLTASYAETLATPLEKKIDSILQAAER
ncbi:acyltransferase family protein [Luteimonas sp. A277]